MKDTPTLPDTKPSALDYIKQSALEYIINYLFDGLEACERNPASDDFVCEGSQGTRTPHKALEAMKVKYVGGKGRGAKSYLVKAA